MVQTSSPTSAAQGAGSPLVVFDLDGTLADTALDLVETLNVILEREGLAPLPLNEARDLIGAGARALITRGFHVRQKPLSPERLDELAAQGYALAVCTNKMQDHSRRLLAELGILDRFVFLAGRDTYPICKPDPRHLTYTIADAKGDPQRAVLIGDSKTDVDTARAANIPVIGVDFGYTETPMPLLKPDRLISHFDALVPAVQALIRL